LSLINYSWLSAALRRNVVELFWYAYLTWQQWSLTQPLQPVWTPHGALGTFGYKTWQLAQRRTSSDQTKAMLKQDYRAMSQ